MARRPASCLSLLIILFLALTSAPQAQERFQDVIEMSVEVGFDSFFRPNQWTPVRVELKNNGESVAGRLVIRPETSGTVVGNAFSAPIDLPSGSEKSAIINIQARSFPDTLRVELIDDAGLVQTSQEAGLIDLQQQDQLYALVTGPNTAALGLAGVHIGGYEAEQALWDIGSIPENGAALQSLDMMMLVNIDSQNLSSRQRRAIRHWLQGGGHLIVTGGPSAQMTAQALMDSLPLVPQDSQSITDLTALARFSGDSQTRLIERTIIATGALHENALVLAEHEGIPLLIRRHIGAGVVDYLTADPSLEPLASWEGISRLWMKLLATRAPHPVWVEGFTRPERGAEAVANLPGVDLLPPIQMLCLFLALYVLLIGPVNYLILSRIHRSGWGWFTIPLVIIAFTGIAWTVGFNLRGTEIIVSRTAFVQSWADSDDAQVNQFIGLLSPRRAAYSLAVPADSFLAVAGATAPSSLFASNAIQTATEIQQGAAFSASDFTIDGGIFANFALTGTIPRPQINGKFTLDFEIMESGRMVAGFQGLIANDSEITLRDAVILGEGLVYRLDGDFAPGDILTLHRDDLSASMVDSPPQPNRLEYHVSSFDSGLSPFAGSSRNISMKNIQGERFLRSRAFLGAESTDDKQAAREQAFLASFMVDQFDSTARGSGLYLVGWRDEWERDLDIRGASWTSVDTTLYIIQLETDMQLPAETATLTSEYFTWMSLSRSGLTGNGTDGFSLFEMQGVEFLFNPLPGLVMDEVDRLVIEVDRSGGYAQSLDTELFNWVENEYDVYTFRDGEILAFDDPRPYLGAGNMVRIRLHYEQGIGTARVRKMRIEQTGRYH